MTNPVAAAMIMMSKDGKVNIQGQFALQSDLHVSPRVATSIRYEEHDPTSLDVEMLFLGGNDELVAAFNATGTFDLNLVKLHPLNKSDNSINLIGLIGWRSSTTSLNLEVDTIEIGIDRPHEEQPTHVHVTVSLQPSGLLTRHGSIELNYNGCIYTRHSDDDQIIVQTSLGPIEAMEAYEYLDGKAFGNKVIHRIQRAWLIGEFKLREEDSLRSLHDRLIEEITPICRALSLCYRQPIDAYQIKYLCLGKDNNPIKGAVHRRKWQSSREKTRNKELIDTYNLRNGGLSHLVNTLKNHPNYKSIEQGITFLSHSYTCPLETAYFTAFSAMETIVNAISEDKDGMRIGRSSWRRVEKALKSSLEQLSDTGSISKHVALLIEKKLPELRRVSLTSKIDRIIHSYPVKTSDLWTEEGFAEGMRRASSFRNDLFHAAHTSDLNLMALDLLRIRAFTERLLLAAIGWPEDRRFLWRDDNIRQIIQPPDPEPETNEATSGIYQPMTNDE